MLKMSRLQKADIPELLKIHNQHNFEWQEPRFDFGTICVRSEDKIIGAGHLRPIVEAVMILDLDASLRDKAIALRHMIHQAVLDSTNLELKEIHAWVKEEQFVRELKKHYGFEEPRGTSLVLRI